MSIQTTLRGSMLNVTRRFAAGIDVGEHSVRLAVVSKRVNASRPVCVERLEEIPLAPGVVIAGDIIDRGAIVDALREAFSRLPSRGSLRSLRCAMALPASATVMIKVPLDRLMHAGVVPASGGSDPLSLLEPAILAEAERASGMERGALSVDWSITGGESSAQTVLIAATARRHVEARIETAAAADIALCTVDGEPLAALRALRYCASTEIAPDERFIACWVESTGMHAWLIGEDGVENEMRFPSPEWGSALEALTGLVDDGPRVHWIYVGGDLELLARAGASMSTLAELFGCPVMPFECAPLCNGAQRVDDELRHSPLYAVALGLALREVLQ